MITQAITTGSQVRETRATIARDTQSEVGCRIDHAPAGVDAVHGVTAQTVATGSVGETAAPIG